MKADAYQQAAAILDAAAAGERLAGFDALGGLLIDLRTTQPVPPGAAMRASVVSVATAATTPGRLAGMAGLVKPGVVVLGLTSLAFAVGLSLNSGASSTEVVPPGPDPAGVERVVDGSEVRSPEASDERDRAASDEAGEIDDDGAPTAPAPADGGADPGASGGADAPSTSSSPASSPAPTPAQPSSTVPETTDPPTTAPETTEPSPTTAPSTTQPPSSTAPPTTTTVSPTTSTPEEQGNNGNDNGNGVGNGKGNNGKGGGRGNGGPPEGDDG